MLDRKDAMNVSTIGIRAREPSKADLRNASAEHQAYFFTQMYSQRMKADSQFFQKNPPQSLPHFEEDEVTPIKTLGQGEFGVVLAIGDIHTKGGKGDTELNPSLSTETASTESTHDDESKTADSFHQSDDIQSTQVGVLSVHLDADLSPIKKTSNIPLGLHNSKNLTKLYESNVSKEYMSTHVFRDGEPRYAVKQLREDLKGDKMIQAIVDLTAEAKFLMSLRHPNICKIRGTIGEPGKRDFAIVLDRLTMTLREKMAEWREDSYESRSLLSKMKKVLIRDQVAKQHRLCLHKSIYNDKLMAVYDVARALRHLAENRIIFRDLKPDNVGVDIRGDLRLFDFGLAKELKDKDERAPDMYKLTGMTGSRRYMAPEVVLCKDYGLAADVYSFAIMTWEVMSNLKAFSYMNAQNHLETVVQRKLRPDLKKMIAKKKVLPEVSQIHSLVNFSWSHEPLERPSIAKVCEVLFAEILNTNIDESSYLATDRSKRLAFESMRSRADGTLWV